LSGLPAHSDWYLLTFWGTEKLIFPVDALPEGVPGSLNSKLVMMSIPLNQFTNLPFFW
jgi:hypothetical protein